MGQMYCVYRGTFTGRTARPDRDTDWMVELWRELDERPARVGELIFPADSPLRIEWEEWRPETALQGSMLTLNIESMTDREFINFYTNRVGNIYIKVYRRGWQETHPADEPRGWCMVWRGALDPEFYEEPYERADGYTVSMTFSDFGALDRLDFDRVKTERAGDDVCPVLMIIGAALHDAGLTDDASRWISEHSPSSPLYCSPVHTWCALVGFFGEIAGVGDLTAISLPWGNFEDEEGTPTTWRDAIEMCLAPLGLHMVQRAGIFQIYDTSWLCHRYGTADKPPFVHWTADTQTLGTAETYNNIEVTFSPYARTEVLTDNTALTNDESKISSTRYMVYRAATLPGGATAWTQEGATNCYPSFDLSRAGEGEGPSYIDNTKCGYFKITPLLGSAQERTGIICNATPGFTGVDASDESAHYFQTLLRYRSTPIAPPLSDLSVGGNFLRLTFDMLFDPRYNPFEDFEPDIEGCVNTSHISEEDWGKMRWAVVPLQIRMLDLDGTPLYHYSNKTVIDYDINAVYYPHNIKFGTWQRWNALESTRCCFAQFYNDEESKAALDGWTANRHTIGVWHTYGIKNMPEKINARISMLPDGMLIPYPPCGGILEVGVLDGVVLHTDDLAQYLKEGVAAKTPSLFTIEECRKAAQAADWRAFADFKVEIVQVTAPYNPIESEDMVTEAKIVSDTRETLDITAKCGSCVHPDASMLGLYRIGTAKHAARSMIRSRHIGSVDQMLVASLFSQYEPRRMTLSGEAEERVADEFPVYRDPNMGDRIFIMQSSTLSAIDGTEELKIVELLPDTFSAENTGTTGNYWFSKPDDEPRREPDGLYPFEFDPKNYNS